MATHGENWWPPGGSFNGRLRGESHGRRHCARPIVSATCRASSHFRRFGSFGGEARTSVTANALHRPISGSRAVLRNLRTSLLAPSPGRAGIAEPCAARQAGLGDVPTSADPGVCRSSARLTRASAPLKRRSRRPGGRRRARADARSRSDSPPKGEKTPIFSARALLVCDEVGYLPLERADANRAFQLINPATRAPR